VELVPREGETRWERGPSVRPPGTNGTTRRCGPWSPDAQCPRRRRRATAPPTTGPRAALRQRNTRTHWAWTPRSCSIPGRQNPSIYTPLILSLGDPAVKCLPPPVIDHSGQGFRDAPGSQEFLLIPFISRDDLKTGSGFLAWFARTGRVWTDAVGGRGTGTVVRCPSSCPLWLFHPSSLPGEFFGGAVGFRRCFAPK
jgi:hypothetical protein